MPERASLMGLTAKEMTCLLGGMRVLELIIHLQEIKDLTNKVGALTNDFFVNLLDMKLSGSQLVKILMLSIVNQIK